MERCYLCNSDRVANLEKFFGCSRKCHHSLEKLLVKKVITVREDYALFVNVSAKPGV
jgi:hypothetical protein